MAEAEGVVRDDVLGDDVEQDPLGWVAPGPRETVSVITSSALGVFTIVEDREENAPCHWRAWSPLEEKRVCSTFSEDGFAMYEYAFRELGFRLPFNELAMNVFGHLMLAPSQLNPNSLAFLRAFEFVCEYLEITPTVHLFLRIFRLKRQQMNGR
jgi:hypothetical protein